ncbi:hypothetical protein PM082_000297 [Marasmius tenuissimus]|nr:hypothetical protein PM082_000297 [Marasmius tenuissimus]
MMSTPSSLDFLPLAVSLMFLKAFAVIYSPVRPPGTIAQPVRKSIYDVQNSVDTATYDIQAFNEMFTRDDRDFIVQFFSA